jgi:hypothetical protein
MTDLLLRQKQVLHFEDQLNVMLLNLANICSRITIEILLHVLAILLEHFHVIFKFFRTVIKLVSVELIERLG